MNKSALTQDVLKQWVNYCPETGAFTSNKESNQWGKGRRVGWVGENGYRYLSIADVFHLEHRLAWLWIHGEMPQRKIDHINRTRDDNRFVNLRLADDSENSVNSGMRRDNKSGAKGVCYLKDRNKWVAQIRFKGEKRRAQFGTKEEAAKFYAEAAKEFSDRFWTGGVLP